MTKTYTIIIAAAIVLCFAFLSAAEINVAELAAGHPVQSAFPGDESVILYEGITYKLDTEGIITTTVHRVRTMFTEHALDNFGDPHIGFFDDGQTLEVEICRAYMLDGRTVDTQKNGFNQITPGALWQFPDYTGFQQLVATHTGLEWGGTSEIKYTISDNEKILGWLEGVEYFQSDEPILHKEVIVIVPDNINLTFSFLNGDGDLKKKVEDGYTTRVWTLKNLPALDHDDAYAFRMNFTPALVFSSCPDWKKAASDYALKISIAAAPSEYIINTAAKELNGCSNKALIIDKLAALVRERLRTVSYNWEFFPWTVRPAEQILASAYGHNFDHAILLTSLLQSQGISARIAVSADVYDKSLKIPALNQFSDYWVAVVIDGKEIFIDPAQKLSKHSQIDLAGQALLYLNYNVETPVIIPEFTLEQNRSALDLNVDIAEDGSYTGSGVIECRAAFSPYYQVGETESGTRGWLESELNGLIPGLTIDQGAAGNLSVDFCSFNFSFSGENLGEPIEDYLVVNIPPNQVGESMLEPDGWNPHLTDRSNPVSFKNPGSVNCKITFNLPDNWTVEHAPESFRKESSVIETGLNVENSAGRLTVSRSFTINEKTVKSDYYSVLHNLYQLLAREDINAVVFKLQ